MARSPALLMALCGKQRLQRRRHADLNTLDSDAEFHVLRSVCAKSDNWWPRVGRANAAPHPPPCQAGIFYTSDSDRAVIHRQPPMSSLNDDLRPRVCSGAQARREVTFDSSMQPKHSVG
jgi:hypothetical protein